MKIRRNGILENQPVTGIIASGAAISGNPVLIGGSDGYNIRTLKTNTDGSLQINSGELSVNLIPLTNASTGQLDVTSTPVLVSASIANRKTIRIKAFINNSTAIYIGFTSGVSSTTGDELSAGEAIDIEIDGSVLVYAVAVSGTQRISWTEVA